MSETPVNPNEFVVELNAKIEQNIANEQFGVSELAEQMNMSRSNLLRKVKKETNLSVSQLISQVRLARAMELLKTTSRNVSEVAHDVGFSSPSYFIKCFREFYGYPPGEVGKRETEPAPASAPTTPEPPRKLPSSRISIPVPLIIGLAVIAISVTAFLLWPSRETADVEKSIAVLPFKNESNDSTNVYLINGIMDATLNNLQQIGELKVVSRTTAEKYRNSSKSISEIAKELNVNYFVEGSGQKIGNRILLNVQLIDGNTDKHLWAKQYRRESDEIFELQQEIANNIADEIQVIITPEQKQRMAKVPTDDLDAYDNFLKGKDLFYRSKPGDLVASVPFFRKAIERDPEFALAYANLALVYYYLDIFQVNKKYSADISLYADKAMLYDPTSGESLVAKAIDYSIKKDYQQAVPFFEKALEYNPTSGVVLHFLVEFYSMYIPNPKKHVQYAIKKLEVDMPAGDSATLGFDYFHLSISLLQAGFLDEAVKYIDKSIEYDPNGYFSNYLRAYIVNLKTNDVQRMKQQMLAVFQRDTNRFDIRQEVAKISFIMRDYDEAYRYYSRFVQIRQALNLDLYRNEDIRIAITYDKMGHKEEAEKFAQRFYEFASNDKSMYKHFFFCMYYGYKNDQRKALDHLKLFSQGENFIYPVICIDDDPLFDHISKHPEFKSTMKVIEDKFWKTNAGLKKQVAELNF
jgi:TolB-like protein/AraC-like DNA-binding protein